MNTKQAILSLCAILQATKLVKDLGQTKPNTPEREDAQTILDSYKECTRELTNGLAS